jgi:hypothetical protein
MIAVWTRLLAIAATMALAHPCTAVEADVEPVWTIALKPSDFIVGPALGQLHARRTWTPEFDAQAGSFEVALRKTAVAIRAPKCRMDYLLLTIPSYYPENPKRASVSERRAVYDALVAIQTSGRGSMTARVEAPLGLARKGAAGIQLVACNLYFALPLSVKVADP